MAFRYRLAPLLERKEQARKEAEAETRRREQELSLQKDLLAEMERRERDLSARRERLRREPILASADEAMKRSEFVKALAADIDAARNDVFAQKIAVDEHEHRVAQAAARSAEARREVEVLVKHRARQEEKSRREEAAREEAELDEIGNVLYTTRRAQL